MSNSQSSEYSNDPKEANRLKTRSARLTAAPSMALILMSLVLQTGCGNQEGSGQWSGGGGRGQWGGRAEGEAAVPVRVAVVARGDMHAYVQTHARLEAERHVDVVARAAGLVTELRAEEGDRVAARAVLARLDRTELSLRLEEVRVALEQARATHERINSLYARDLVSEEELDAARNQFSNAEVKVKEAQLNLTYTDLRAPIPGVVMERRIERGDMVNVNQQIFSVADLEPLLARIHIPEQRMHQVRPGQKARIAIDSLPESAFEGIVRMINPGVDPQSGTVKVTIEIPTTGTASFSKRLRPGMFANVMIVTDSHPQTLIIPKQALILETDEEDVFLFEDGRARRVGVELGFTEGNQVEVRSGLAEGAQVITVGQEGLKDGQAVRLAGQLASIPDSMASSGSSQTADQGRQWGGSGGGRWSGGDSSGARSMPDSASFVQRVQERRGLSEAEAIERWKVMKERMKDRQGGAADGGSRSGGE